ncbi:MAG TPA: hypothetical protein VK606_11330 [Verrucomicrobiae bacterium]|nr:hypothetical protein [Verrucomicrobiae bacterium]
MSSARLGKRLMIALALTLLAVAGCNDASASGAQPAPQRFATQSPAPASEPHGGIGDAAVATAP